MKVSVIVPIYNTSKYLEKCINSIINQTIGFENIELILVNDGSTDDSEKIIKKYLKAHKNIKYIYQENSGLSSARNSGLKIASGEYISFVDSDDWINENMYELMLHNNDKYDIIVCNICFTYPTVIIKRNMKRIDDLQKNFILTNSCACNILMKKSFLDKNNFEFPEGIIYEDLASIPPLASKTKKIIYLNEYLYYYVQRLSSTVHHNKYNKKILNIYDSLDIFSNSFKKNNTYDKFYNETEYNNIYNLILLSGGGFIKYKETKDELKHIKSIMKADFPNWRKNKYYKSEKIINKIKINLLYSNKKLLFKFLVKFENAIKRLRRIVK